MATPPRSPSAFRLRDRRRLRPAGLLTLLMAAAVAGGCSEDANPLAPYEGGRPLDLLRVTQSFTPEMQWVGGRVAAVGVNRGTRAALDSTLVWLRTAPGDDIGSFVTVGQETARALIESYGGTPQDSLADGETYTFWLAERSAFDAGLDSTRLDDVVFADTTMTMRLIIRGQNGGSQVGATFVIERDQRLTGDRLVMRWTPGVAFRQMAIRRATVGGFQDLVWWIDSPAAGPPLITPPVTIGVAPDGTQELTAFPESGFEATTYFLWAVTDDWTGSFAPNAPGYAWFRLTACNFDPDNPCP